MQEKLEKKTEESINKILEEGLNTNNLDYLYKLTKINHIAKEENNMYGEYGNYSGRRAGYDSYGRGNYGEYGNYGRDAYGRRGYDMKYRGEEELDRMHGEYGRYQESRNRYGAGSEESDKSFHYMVKALEDFIMVLHEEAESEQQKQQLRQALQNSMR
jgi:hypothetical protein